MFGIDFPGSPRVDESFVLEGWDEIPPMRREFDTREYSERTYFPRPGRSTAETKAHMKEKLYPDPTDPGDADLADGASGGVQTHSRGGE
jgi:NADH-quinone oxidoreductase subunit C